MGDAEGSNYGKWNEVVLDMHIFLADMKKDPVHAVPAIVYVANSARPHLYETAKHLRNDYCRGNGHPKGDCIPVVAADPSKKVMAQEKLFYDPEASASTAAFV